MPTTQKTERVTELAQLMSEAKSMYLADFTGVDVASVTQLRRSLREASVDYQVVKNRLAKLAAVEVGLGVLEGHLSGPTAVAFAQDDPIEPARIIQKFIDGGGKLVIKAGVMDGKLLGADEVERLASLPSRDELIAKTIGAIQGPLYGLSAVLTGLLRNLVGTLSALEEQRRTEGGDETSPAPAESDT